MENKKCRICKNEKLDIVIDLGNQKITSIFKEYGKHNDNKSYPISLCMCNNCGLIQLNETT